MLAREPLDRNNLLQTPELRIAGNQASGVKSSFDQSNLLEMVRRLL